MYILCAAVALIIMCTNYCSAGLYPHPNKYDSWGYLNSSGTIVIAPQYYFAMDYKCGMAIAIRNGVAPREMVCLDTSGNTIYTTNGFITGYSEDLAAVQAGHNWLYIDKNGDVAIDGPFNYAHQFRGGYGVVGIADNQGVVRYNLIDKSGRFFLSKHVDYVKNYDDGYAVVRDGDIYRIIARNAKVKYETRRKIKFYSKGFICIEGQGVNLIYQVPDLSMNTWTLEHRFSTKKSFAYEDVMDEYFVMKDAGGYYLYDINGGSVLETSKEFIGRFFNGMTVVKSDELYGVLNKNKEWVIPPKYDYLEFPQDGKLIRFSKRRGDTVTIGYINIQNMVVWQRDLSLGEKISELFYDLESIR